MYGHEKKKDRRNSALAMDVFHIVIGALVVLLAVIVFLNPDGNQILLPLIFVLAAVLNIVNGIHKFRISGRDSRKKAAGAALLLLAAVLLLIAVVSAVSIWN